MADGGAPTTPGAIVKAWREAAGLTQIALAEKLGQRGRTTVANIEQGINRPSPAFAEKIAGALGQDAAPLLAALVAPAIPEGTTVVLLVPRGQIRRDPHQPRRTSAEETFDHADLLPQIREQGIVTPLDVGPMVSGAYPLRDGERRLDCADELGLDEVPVLVGPDLAPEDVLARQLTSFARAPLSPLAEARAFARMRELLSAGGPGASAGEVADRIGLGVHHVRRRLALLDLVPEAQELLASEGVALAVAQLIAQISPDGQRTIVERCREILARDPTEAPLRREDIGGLIDGQRRRLGNVPWDLGDAATPGGACDACPKRTSAQLALLGEVPATDQCTDRVCFERNEVAWREKRDEKIAEQEVGPEKAAKGKAAKADAFKPPTPEPPPLREKGKGLPVVQPRGSAADDAKIERLAKDAARERALLAVGSAFAKRKPDEKFWRLLAGLTLRNVDAATGSAASDALDRRGIGAVPGTARGHMLGIVGAASESECRGMIVELLAAADETGDEDDVYVLACRAAKVDHAALAAEEREKLAAKADKPGTGKVASEKGNEEKVLRAAAGEYRTAAYIATKTGLTIPAVKKICRTLSMRGGSRGLATRNAPGEDESYRGHYGEAPTPPVEKGEPKPETVQLAGEARAAAEAHACSKCSAKVGKVCTGPKGKLGAGWFHVERQPPERVGGLCRSGDHHDHHRRPNPQDRQAARGPRARERRGLPGLDRLAHGLCTRRGGLVLPGAYRRR